MNRLFVMACLFVISSIFLYGRDAEACVVFYVTDNQGVPVQDANVNVYFDMHDRADGRRVIGNTDLNGLCRLHGRTSHTLEIEVTKSGYYRYKNDMNLNKHYEIVSGKWLPWESTKSIVLPKIRNQIAEGGKTKGWRYVKDYNKWIGFDIVVYDYVAPWGKGEKSDFEIRFEWDGAWRRDYRGITLDVRFVEKYAGAYMNKKIEGSDFPGVYFANTNTNYLTQYRFYDKAITNAAGKVIKWEEKMFDKNKVLVGRSRCELDASGKLLSAVYFQIVNLSFACGQNGAGLRCTPYYNPIPNDTNIEPKK